MDKKRLIQLARKHISGDDPSHDINHALRVLSNAQRIASHEGGDMQVLIPAALFHDLVNHPKNSPRSRFSAQESAAAAGVILSSINYPKEKTLLVIKAIREHSYSNAHPPSFLESKILQDADKLEATGAIAIMRTFCSSGQMKRGFYDPQDPFCQQREPTHYSLDFFYQRLLKAKDVMHTNIARELAEKRTLFLYAFLEQLKTELET